MMIQARTERACLSIAEAHALGYTVCPFGPHYHGGDAIERELEMILCHEDARRAIDDGFWGQA